MSTNPTTTGQLAAQLRALSALNDVNLTSDEREALQDAADRLDKGQGAVYTIGRLLAPFLGRLVTGKRHQATTMPVGTWPTWDGAEVLAESRQRTADRKDGQA